MQAARRLYLYAMSGITLAVIAAGLVLLFRVLLDGVFPDPFEGDGGSYDNSREQLSQAIAMLGVGAPVWAVHWWLVQRGLREGRPERDAERGAGIRAVYLTGILLISLLVWVPSAVSVLHWLATNLLNAVPEYTYADPLGAASVGLAGFAIWLYHGLVRRRDLAAGPVSGPAAWIPRLYLYGVAVGALVVALTTFGSIVGSLFFAGNIVGGDSYATYSLVQQVISTIAWALVWFGHWAYANRMIRHPDWRGVEERTSRTRVAAFAAVIVAAATASLGDLAAAASGAMRPLLPSPEGPIEADLASIAVPLAGGAIWAVAWYAHLRWLRREPAAADPLRARHQERLVSHEVAAVGLAIGAVGGGWLLGYLVNLVFGGQQTAFDYPSWELAQFVPLTVVGLGAWLWFWRGVVARRRADPAGEANSTIRRTFLFITLGVALVVALAAAAAILYRLVGLVINAGAGGSIVSELSTPIGALLGAGIVLLYHGLALRADLRLAVATAPPGAESITADSSPSPLVRRRDLALLGPADQIDAALEAARTALPAGFEFVDAEGEAASST